MKNKLVVLSGAVMGFAPMVALAQAVGAGNFCGRAGAGTLNNIICRVGDILNAIIPVLVVLGIVYFVWGVISYVIAGDEEAKSKGRDRIIYGIIGLVVIVAMWGLVNILVRTFDLNQDTTVELPQVIIP